MHVESKIKTIFYPFTKALEQKIGWKQEVKITQKSPQKAVW